MIAKRPELQESLRNLDLCVGNIHVRWLNFLFWQEIEFILTFSWRKIDTIFPDTLHNLFLASN